MKTFDQLLISCRDNPTDLFLWEVCRDLCEEIYGHRNIEPFIPTFPLLGWNGWFSRRFRRTTADPNFHPSQLENLSFYFNAGDISTFQPPIAIFDRELNLDEMREMDNYIASRFGLSIPPRE